MIIDRKLRTVWKALLVSVLLLCPTLLSAEAHVVHELILKMESGYAPGVVLDLFPDVDTVQSLPQLEVYLLSHPSSGDLALVAAEIEALIEVEFCHPNYLIDPLNGVQSSLPISDEVGGQRYYGQDVTVQLELAAAHALSNGSGVKVGVLDGGVNYAHQDLSSVASSGWDYVLDEADAYDDPGGENSGHGTFVAGVIHLVAPEAEVIAYRVTDLEGESNGYIVAEAILQAVEDGCRVINLSMVTVAAHEAIGQALNYARNHGALVVAAAGNGHSSDAHYPASDPNALGVAAIDSQLTLADFSSYGGHVDVCAPGTEIYAPYLDRWAYWGGTSFATPFVTAQAALILSLFPWASGNDVRNVILETAFDIDDFNSGYEGQLGNGCINPLESVSGAVCGNVDANPDGRITLSDVTLLIDHLYLSQAPLPDPEVADMDDWLGITGNDVAVLFDHLYGSYDSLDCDPSHEGAFPVSSTCVLEARNIVIPAGNSTWAVEIWLDPGGGYGSVTLPFTIGGSNPGIEVESMVVNDTVGYTGPFDLYDNDDDHGVISAFAFDMDEFVGTHRVAIVNLTGTYADTTQTVSIDTAQFPAGNSVVISLGGGHDPVTPTLAGFAGNFDTDGDGVANNLDNCVMTYNPGQEDGDGDGVGDACDICLDGDDQIDADSDGIPDACDNCPSVANNGQADDDSDGYGDACDVCTGGDDGVDTDSDGLPDGCDNCPTVANADQYDRDGDGIGTDCDDCIDTDGDGFGDPGYDSPGCADDNCWRVYNPDQSNRDGDTHGDACDNCPDYPALSIADIDDDGVGDPCDDCVDPDNDGYTHPGYPNTTCGVDNCALTWNPDQADSNSNGIGDACDGVVFQCGNINGDPLGSVNISDMVYLINYCHYGGPLEYPERADLDDWYGITTNDYQYLISVFFVYYDIEDLDCTPQNGGIFPPSLEDSIRFANTIIPAGSEEWAVEIWIKSGGSYSGMCLPFSFDCSNPGVGVSQLVMDSTFTTGEAANPISDYDQGSSSGYVSALSTWDPMPNYGNWTHVADLVLSNTLSGGDHIVMMDTLMLIEPAKTVVISRDDGRNPVTPTIVGVATETDSDGDGVMDAYDNCFSVANPSQVDGDSDGIGDACDNCVETPNPDQADEDFDGVGNLCDVCPGDPINDDDGDLVCGLDDNCPSVANAGQEDGDGDGVGDLCDICPGSDDLSDIDGDLVPDDCDNCLMTPNANQSDLDSDGIGDMCDLCPDGPESCASICTNSGDVNFDGVVDHTDLTYLIDYVYLAGAVPPNPINADCDDHEGITTRDVMYLSAHVNGTGPALTCPPTYSGPPEIDSGVVLRYGGVVDPYASKVELSLTLLSDVPVIAFNFPLEIRIGDSIIPAIDSFVVSPLLHSRTEETWEFYPETVFRTDSATGTALISAVGFDGATSLTEGGHPLGTLHMTVQPSSAEREFTVAFGAIRPVGELPLGYPDNGIYPVVISPGDISAPLAKALSSLDAGVYPQYGPVLATGGCCGLYTGGMTGNTDCGPDGKRTLADIARLIDRVYISRTALCCEENGNVGSSSSEDITLSDITRLIDHVYISKQETEACQ